MPLNLHPHFPNAGQSKSSPLLLRNSNSPATPHRSRRLESPYILRSNALAKCREQRIRHAEKHCIHIDQIGSQKIPPLQRISPIRNQRLPANAALLTSRLSKLVAQTAPKVLPWRSTIPAARFFPFTVISLNGSAPSGLIASRIQAASRRHPRATKLLAVQRPQITRQSYREIWRIILLEFVAGDYILWPTNSLVGKSLPAPS